MDNTCEVLIVGAGPTGLVAALELARRGIRCRIIEKSDEFFNGSRGKGVSPRTLEAFDDLGVIDEILDDAEPNPPFKLYNRDKPTGVLYFQGGDGKGNASTPRRTRDADIPYPVMVVLPQWRTEEILRRHAAAFGVNVELGKEFVALEQDASGVAATIRDGSGLVETIRCDYLIGADGGRSAVRHALALDFEGTTSTEQTYLIADLEIDGLDHRFRYGWSNSETHGFAQACPMKDSPIWQFGVNMFAVEGPVPEPSLELFRTEFEKITGITKYTFRDPIWMSKWVFHARMVSDYRRGRVFIGGDAAHAHSPVTGEGLNAGVQDAYNLSWKLALVLRSRADVSLLDTYSEERVPVARAVLSSSTSGHMTLFSTKFATKILRQWIVLPALRIPAVNRRVMRRLSGLDVNYRSSSLSVQHTQTKAPVQAGDRAPDGWLTNPASGEAIRLFDILRGPVFTLLAFGDIDHDLLDALTDDFGASLRVRRIVPSIGDAGFDADALVDQGRRTARRYGIKEPTVLVIRPDGYVGYRGGVARPPLWAYLQRFAASPKVISA